MSYLKAYFKNLADYLKSFIKWIILSAFVGTAGGVIGSLFHISIDLVTHLRENNSYIIYFLPVGGVAIVFMYRFFRAKGHIDTNRVLEAVRTDSKVPAVMIPLIFVGTVITHMLGGSAGREGAALQLGGGIGYNFGKAVHLEKNDLHLITMAGMSAVFSALFGTPLTAAVFSLEVVNVGIFHYAGFLPCIISAVIAFKISDLFGISPVRFENVVVSELSAGVLARVAVLAVLCAVVSILFCTAIKLCEHYSEKFIKNKFLRAAVCAEIIVILTMLVGTFDYNGAGMSVINLAMGGSARPEAFLLKIVFTAVTIAAGFKGGEIVPAFFIGSTFGCVAGAMLGLDAGFGAAIGFAALFCGVVNCPMASVFLAVEVFGTEGLLYFAVVCAVSYMMSGYSGLYKSQRILYSKINDEFIDISTK